VFEEGETAQVLGEINKIDRNFRVDEFTKHIETTVAPVIIEVTSDLQQQLIARPTWRVMSTRSRTGVRICASASLRSISPNARRQASASSLAFLSCATARCTSLTLSMCPVSIAPVSPHCILHAPRLIVHNAQLAAARMMEQGPVLIFTFYTQQIICVRDASGAIKEGGEVCF
jgi:hypothetical protein